LDKLTKRDIKTLLEDYEVPIEYIHHSQLKKANAVEVCTQLNAILCIQHYLNRKMGNYRIINEICPITIEKINKPIQVVFKNTNIPFDHFISQYEIGDFAKYLLTTATFIDINTQQNLSRLQLQKIDVQINRHGLFVPSIYNLYQSKIHKNTILETQTLLLGLERCINNEIYFLYDYISGVTEQTYHKNAIKTDCIAIQRVLNQMKKVDAQHMYCVKNHIITHLNMAENSNKSLERGEHNEYILNFINGIV
tara:strand:- start:5207 stop:5959 length:753 start_codon:yes stop_codon:yes gene_type:complete